LIVDLGIESKVSEGYSMQKIIQRTNIPAFVFVLLGLALIFGAYLLAGGQDRLMPMYGFPEPAFGCNFDDIGVITTVQPPELSRGYRQSELLWCYPPQYFPLYALAIVGVVMCGWTLLIMGKGLFQRERHAKENFLGGIGGFMMALLIILTGGRIFKLEIDLIGGGHPEPPDIFNSLALVLVPMGFLWAIVGVVSVGVGAIKAIKNR
jgi:hypothetical protein